LRPRSPLRAHADRWEVDITPESVLDGGRSGRLFAEVDDWFASEETDGPFAFAAICRRLKVHPACIRNALERWRARSKRRGVARGTLSA